ncbi:hypothetical protein KAU55_00515 [Candidatus Bathyarchaeota archaeon]|nr:hypothetical protein [Candidatus Bathyarchaeota archaeon]
MEIELKSGPQGHIYLPKRIRTNWGKNYKLTPNWKAGVIYPSDAKPEDVLKSLETLVLEFKHRTASEET